MRGRVETLRAQPVAVQSQCWQRLDSLISLPSTATRSVPQQLQHQDSIIRALVVTSKAKGTGDIEVQACQRTSIGCNRAIITEFSAFLNSRWHHDLTCECDADPSQGLPRSRHRSLP
jgi:hypothetical protein